MLFDRLQIISEKSFQSNIISVIGNAGITQNDVPRIEASLAIRFNNYATRAGIGHHTSKCDMLWTTGDLHSQGSSPSSVVVGIPFPFKTDSLPSRLNRWYSKSTPYTVNPYWCYEMNQELGIPSEGWKHPFPSIGFTCLWHLHKLISTSKFRPSVYVAGFNFYHDKGRIQGIIPSRDYTVNRHKCFNHHYILEVKWIMEKLWNHPCFQFSPEINKIFQSLKPKLL